MPFRRTKYVASTTFLTTTHFAKYCGPKVGSEPPGLTVSLTVEPTRHVVFQRSVTWANEHAALCFSDVTVKEFALRNEQVAKVPCRISQNEGASTL